MKTEYEKRAWKSFEKILEFRSLAGLIISKIMILTSMSKGIASFQMSKEVYEKLDNHVGINKELIQSLYPYVVFAFYLDAVIGVVILLIATRKRSICKVLFY